MKIDLKKCPAVIRESVEATLRARGFRIVDASGADVTTESLAELGNNVAQALVWLDEEVES